MHTTTQCVEGDQQVEFAAALRYVASDISHPRGSQSLSTLHSELLLPVSTSPLNDSSAPISPAEAEARIGRFVRYVDSIVIGKGWFGFSIGWGDNIVTFFDEGAQRGVYDPTKPEHQYVHSFTLPFVSVPAY